MPAECMFDQPKCHCGSAAVIVLVRKPSAYMAGGCRSRLEEKSPTISTNNLEIGVEDGRNRQDGEKRGEWAARR